MILENISKNDNYKKNIADGGNKKTTMHNNK